MRVDEVVMRKLAGALLVLVLGCGGKVDGEAPGSAAVPRSGVPPRAAADEADDMDDVTPPSGAEEGEWGTWQLLSVEGPDGKRQYDPPFVELDLHPNGAAYLWTCSEGLTGTGRRCPFYARMNCFEGTIASDGAAWHVSFPTKRGTNVSGRGEIVEEPSGDIMVKGEGALLARGHYRRVAAPSLEGCVP